MALGEGRSGESMKEGDVSAGGIGDGETLRSASLVKKSASSPRAARSRARKSVVGSSVLGLPM